MMSMSIRQILYAVSLVLVTAGLSLGADLYFTYQSFLAMENTGPSVRRKAPVPLSNKVKKIDYLVIEKRNLFSSTPLGHTKKRAVRPKSKPRKVVVRPTPKLPGPSVAASLDLQLVGTTVGPEGMSFAIFKEKGSSAQKIHRLGDSIKGALIKEVKRGEVSLEYNGKIQIFKAFKDRKSDTRGSRHSNSRRPSSGRSKGSGGPDLRSRLRRPPGNDLPGNPQIPRALSPEVLPQDRGARAEPSKRTRILSRKRLERLLNSAGELDSQFRTTPFRSPEGDTGVRVFPAGRGRFLRLLGIRGGDVVIDVNGSGINNKGDLSSAFRGIMRQDAAQIAIFRQGKKVNISYRIR
ncbi:MAG: hypothetical protein HN435_02910 [Nitrospinaceae bacterium]|nr:hypothetical protein [Nitrospinaceae bacterium]MBT3821437.1 hypothetical protein [Nitrospinaceae bacterium]